MPPDLKERIEAAASEAGRSINAEIILRLQNSFTAQAGPPDMDAFAEDLANRLAGKLKQK